MTEEVRSPRVTANVSEVSANAHVREAMVDMQRAVTAIGDVVVDGRDIGTVVCPDAGVKIFLTASNSERARRRRLELEAKGIDVPQDKMEQEISARDEYDSSRKVSPLKAADDAVRVDTTDLGIDDVVDRVSEIIEAKPS